MDPELRKVRARGRRPGTFQIVPYRPTTRDEARVTAEHARDWLAELAFMPELGHEGEHAVAEAMRALRAVCGFLRSAKRCVE